mmetsp:Transcript_33085/g.104025  ORF Transcript_33085/g.104025 Transcript_33085/m.104025 type:complete len:333 (+) Transcript_33085:68-1066(+)
MLRSLFSLLLLRVFAMAADRPARLRAVFSDLDGTLVHFPSWFEEHGAKIVSRDAEAKRCVVESATGERRECRLLPSSTMGDGVVSERTVELVRQLRAEGVLFAVVTAARKSTLLARLPLLPACDVAVGETGSRILLEDGAVDVEWAARFEAVCGPLEREMDVALRPEPLWRLFRRLQSIRGLKCDARSYYGCFRADTGDDPSVDAALRACVERELPAGVSWAMNLGKYDFYPALSGKGNAVSYLQAKHGVAAAESACLFDDDNDLPMAERCGVHLLPGLTSASVAHAAEAHPDWYVAPSAGQGVFAVEECLERLLARVRAEKAGEGAQPVGA